MDDKESWFGQFITNDKGYDPGSFELKLNKSVFIAWLRGKDLTINFQNSLPMRASLTICFQSGARSQPETCARKSVPKVVCNKIMLIRLSPNFSIIFLLIAVHSSCQRREFHI
jgi:hypothetical protein